MRFAPHLRRLAPALLAGLVLLASLASGAHAHAAPARGLAFAAEAEATAHAGSADLGCALCAHGERLAHGAAHAPTSALAACAHLPLAPGRALSTPRRLLLERLAPRAPPRIG